MRAMAARFGDALLERLLPAGEAGACVVGNGQKCKCGSPCGVTWCTQWYINCFGHCAANNGVHC